MEIVLTVESFRIMKLSHKGLIAIVMEKWWLKMVFWFIFNFKLQNF